MPPANAFDRDGMSLQKVFAADTHVSPTYTEAPPLGQAAKAAGASRSGMGFAAHGSDEPRKAD
jgi:hypothetical protein